MKYLSCNVFFYPVNETAVQFRGFSSDDLDFDILRLSRTLLNNFQKLKKVKKRIFQKRSVYFLEYFYLLDEYNGEL